MSRFLSKPLPGAQINHTHRFGNPSLLLFLNEGTGSRAGDSGGNGNHGTLKGMVPNDWMGSPRGGALNFDGINNWIDIPANPSLDVEHVTISAWLKSDKTGDEYGFTANIINKSNTNPGTYLLAMLNTVDKIMFQIRLDGSEGTARRIFADTTLDTDWHFYVGTYDGNIMKLYVDNILQADTLEIAGTIDTDNSGILRIGTHPTVTSNIWDGLIEDVRIDPGAFSVVEANQLWLNPYAMFPRPNISRYFVPPTGFVSYPHYSGMNGGMESMAGGMSG